LKSSKEIDRGAPRDRRCTESALLLALANPATYGGVHVTVHETHASWVFVAGERAFKIKKPVALGFLDYSTAARRHAACVEEVRVNQELAPDVYLGVRAIVRTDTGFAFTADHEAPEAVEYAVEMRSFDESDTLAGLIASEALTSGHIEALARRLAEFHRIAPVVAGGGVTQVLDECLQNIRELREASQPLELPVSLAESFVEMFVRVHAGEIERRRGAGLVRDVHGDLRCEHVLLTPSVRIVDRIEFDPLLRHSDIACDLAFLTMDLEAHGQLWAAERLLSVYRDCGMDTGGDALLSFYGANRALVRAKVALIGAAEHDDALRTALLAQTRSMWVLAERLCWRARAPLALVVCGPPASGKSTLAGELSSRSGFDVLSSDVVRKSAAGLKATDRAAPEHYSHRFTHHTYELLARQAHDLISHGNGVIVDATCGSRADRSTLLGRLGRMGVPRLVVRCEIPLGVALRRAAQRLGDPHRVSDASPEIVAEQYHSFQPLEELPPNNVFELNTQLPLDTQAFRVTRAVDRLLSTGASHTCAVNR
jgi:aminoglycoside phosphotransferase family enzyme/predicted kinase